MQIRQPAVAGRFYPSSETELRGQIAGFLATASADLPACSADWPKAIIAPHAGTIYSGPIAASAYVRLGGSDGQGAAQARIQRVVLIGPAHRVFVKGVATSSAGVFASPLGHVHVDKGAISQLLTMPGVEENDEAHRLEHSLEVHLPFLQLALGEFRLVPLVVGQASAELVAEVLMRVWGGDETLVVVSSDLSHFHDYDVAATIDRETSSMIESLELEALTGERACGYQPIRGLLHIARERHLEAKLVDLRSSGDTAGAKREVVGYGSYILG